MSGRALGVASLVAAKLAATLWNEWPWDKRSHFDEISSPSNCDSDKGIVSTKVRCVMWLLGTLKMTCGRLDNRSGSVDKRSALCLRSVRGIACGYVFLWHTS